MARTATTSRKRGTTRATRGTRLDSEPDANSDSSEEVEQDEDEEENEPEDQLAEEDLVVDAIEDDLEIPEVQVRNEVVEYYCRTLGFNRTAALSLYEDQGLHESQQLINIGNHDLVDKLCKLVRSETKTSISLRAHQNLAMLVYYLRHRERTSRVVPTLTSVYLSDIETLDHHRVVEEDWAKTHKDPDPTPVTLDSLSAAKAFNQMRQILTNMRGVSKAPLAYVIRRRILPPDPGYTMMPPHNLPYGHADSPYTSHEDEMIQRAPILAENRPEWHNLHNLESLEDTGARHLTFNADNRTVFHVLFSYWGKNPAWSNVKGFTRKTDGRAAYRTLYNYFFGTNSVQTQTKSVLASLDSFRYEECRKNFTFETYVLKHIEQHNLHNELVEHGADPISESMKIHYFQTGILNKDFDSVKNALLASPDNFQTFDRVKDMFMNFHRSRPRPDGPARTRAIASIRGRGSRHDGPQQREARTRDRGRGSGFPDCRRAGLPSQIEVDRCTHIRDRTYTREEYENLSAAEKQRFFQIRKGKTTRPEGGTRPYPRDSRSVSSTLTDPSSARKRSAAAANLKSDQSDDNASLFSDSDQDMMTDKRSRNRANARQTPP